MREALVDVRGVHGAALGQAVHVRFGALGHIVTFSGTPAKGFHGTGRGAVRHDEHTDRRHGLGELTMVSRRHVPRIAKVVADAPESIASVIVCVSNDSNRLEGRSSPSSGLDGLQVPGKLVLSSGVDDLYLRLGVKVVLHECVEEMDLVPALYQQQPVRGNPQT